jgi:hypothetical protein
MTSPHRRLASIAITAFCVVPAAGALAAQASAATLAANKPCYVNAGEAAAMTITGSGFAPLVSVTLSGGGTSGTATSDAAGNVSIQAPAPQLRSVTPGQKTSTLTATDANGTSAQVKVQSANLAVATKPGSVRNVAKDKVTFRFSGFVPGKHIFGYYLSKKVVGKTKFAKAQGPCGMLKQKALLFPGGHPKKDSYKVTFESSGTYDKNAFPRVTGMLQILHF